MSYTIRTQFQGPGFVAVPNYVAADERLSADALGVLVYLAAMPSGFTVRVGDIMARFKLGKDRWQRIARELRAAGALHVEPLHDRQSGRVYGRAVIVRWPEMAAKSACDAEGRETRLSGSQPKAGTSGSRAGTSGSGKLANPAPYKEQEFKEGAQAGGYAPSRPAARGPAARSVGPVPDVAALPSFVRSCILSGKSVTVGGVLIRPGSPEAEAMQQALRLQDAENGARPC